MSRLLWLPAIWLCGAYSFVQWVMHYDRDALGDEKDDQRLEHFLGWLDPQMDQHWDRFLADKSFHNIKNLGSEHARLDAQRSYKFHSFVEVMLALLVLLLLLAIIF